MVANDAKRLLNTPALVLARQERCMYGLTIMCGGILWATDYKYRVNIVQCLNSNEKTLVLVLGHVSSLSMFSASVYYQ